MAFKTERNLCWAQFGAHRYQRARRTPTGAALVSAWHCLRCAPRPAERLGAQLDHVSIVSRNVIGLATGDQAPIDHDLFVDPVCPGILEVRPERRPRRHATPSRTRGLDNHPGSMAD